MNNNIKVLSRSEFKKYINSLSSDIFESQAFISIHDSTGPNSNEIIKGVENVLNLFFDDVEHTAESKSIFAQKTVPFDQKMAEDILTFVDKYKNAEKIVIHCTFGKCRSGAVGDALSTYLGIPYSEFKKDNPRIQPNTLVRKTLINKINNFNYDL